MALQLRKAERKQAKLKLGVTGPSGSGKTYSALLLARGLVDDWSDIALIDSENGSGELYSHLGDYNVLSLEAPYSPERYIEAIDVCLKGGVKVIVIDSVSHEWDGPGGALEIYENLGGRFQDWAKVTPRHRKFLEKILLSPVHVITTARKKQDYSMDKNSDGKATVTKVGLKEVQRDGFEYELTINFDLMINHYATASKDRTGMFKDKPEFIIDEETGKKLRAWAESGKEDPDLLKREIMNEVERLDDTLKGLDIVAFIKKHTGKDPATRDPDTLTEIRNKLREIKGIPTDESGEEGDEPSSPEEPTPEPDYDGDNAVPPDYEDENGETDESPSNENETIPEEIVPGEIVDEDPLGVNDEIELRNSSELELFIDTFKNRDPWDNLSDGELKTLGALIAEIDGVDNADDNEEVLLAHVKKTYGYKRATVKAIPVSAVKQILDRLLEKSKTE